MGGVRYLGACITAKPSFFFPKRDGAAGQVPSDGSWLPQTSTLCPYISWQRSPCAASPVQVMLKPAGAVCEERDVASCCAPAGGGVYSLK